MLDHTPLWYIGHNGKRVENIPSPFFSEATYHFPKSPYLANRDHRWFRLFSRFKASVWVALLGNGPNMFPKSP